MTQRIPPYQDMLTLKQNLCLSERTIDVYVKEGRLPPPKNKGGKRLWKWSEVEAYIDGNGDTVASAELEDIRNETKKQANSRR